MMITKRGFICLAAGLLAASLFAGHHHRPLPRHAPHGGPVVAPKPAPKPAPHGKTPPTKGAPRR